MYSSLPLVIAQKEGLTNVQDILQAFNLSWIGNLMYHFLYLLVIAVVVVGQMLSVWSRQELSIFQELRTVTNDGFHIMVRQPWQAWRWVYAKGKIGGAWAYGAGSRVVVHRVNVLKHRHAGRIAAAGQAWRVATWRVVEKVVPY